MVNAVRGGLDPAARHGRGSRWHGMKTKEVRSAAMWGCCGGWPYPAVVAASEGGRAVGGRGVPGWREAGVRGRTAQLAGGIL